MGFLFFGKSSREWFVFVCCDHFWWGNKTQRGAEFILSLFSSRQFSICFTYFSPPPHSHPVCQIHLFSSLQIAWQEVLICENFSCQLQNTLRENELDKEWDECNAISVASKRARERVRLFVVSWPQRWSRSALSCYYQFSDFFMRCNACNCRICADDDCVNSL